MESVLAFALSSVIGVGLAATTYWFARRSGLTQTQSALIATVTANARALEDRVGILERLIAEKDTELARLHAEITDLKSAMVHMATENATLHKRLAEA